MRKLASIKQISDLQPIKDRDKIELATIDGWQVIVKKDEFHVGDLCVYIEIDSILPEKPEFEFLRSKNFRIRTMKMAGVISQGICFPLSILPKKNWKLDDDVTSVIGVTKYEQTTDDPIKPNKSFLMRYKWFRKLKSLFSKKSGSKEFPNFIKKTDEVRIQNVPELLHEKKTWIITEKIDGQSGTYILKKEKGLFKNKLNFMICSRNRQLSSNDSGSYVYISKKYPIEDFLKTIIDDYNWVAIQGEIVGPKIQSNKYSLNDYDFYVFNVIKQGKRLNSLEARDICNKFGLKFVPILEVTNELPDNVNDMLIKAHGKSQLADIYREGLVIRSTDETISFKAVDPLFLLKYDE